MTYPAKNFWEKRLKAKFSLSGVGHSGFSEGYNRYMYKLKKQALGDALLRNKIEVEGKRVLDIGCGTGFFVDYYIQRKAASVTGVDITDISINSLSACFPAQFFYKLNIGKELIPANGGFDIVNIFDVLYHIVDNDEFAYAMQNIYRCCNPGAWLFITDNFYSRLGNVEHVKYRSLEDYEHMFKKTAIEIIEIIPVFNLMGKSPAGCIGNNLLGRICARAIESWVGFIYLLDKIYLPKEKSSLYLLICRKN